MVLFAQDGNGNGAKTLFGFPEPRTRAERAIKHITQWVIVVVVVGIAIGLVGLSLRFARWGVTGVW